jgi:hypothetical protein
MQASILFLFSLLEPCLADVLFTSPSAGSVVEADSAFSISWVESGFSPPIADLTSYQLFLCVGGNDASSIVQLLMVSSDGNFPSSQMTIQFNSAIGASEPQNA